MDILQTVTTSVFTSGIITTIIIFMVRRYVEQIFKERIEEFKAELSLSIKAREKLLNKKIDFYPKLVELVYRSRNYVREITETKNDASTTKNKLEETFYSLENCLYQYRLDIDEDDFSYLHKFKNELRTFIGVYNRIKSERKKTAFNITHIEEMDKEMDKLYFTITNRLKQKLSSYASTK